MYGFTSFPYPPSAQLSSAQPSSAQQQYYDYADEDYADDAEDHEVPSIEIDGIIFTIICKSEQLDKYDTGEPVKYEMKENAQRERQKAGARGNAARFVLNSRDMVCFISSALPGVLLYAYRSSSELGIWRLAFIDAYLVLYKGILDYVQGTLIHHHLISLINTQWDFIPHIDETIIRRYPTLCCAQEFNFNTNRYGSRFCLVAPFADSTIRAMIDNKNRQVFWDNGESIKKQSYIDYFSTFFGNPSKSAFAGINIECSNRKIDTLHRMYHMLTNGGEQLSKAFYIQEALVGIGNYTFMERYAGIKAEIVVCTQKLTYERNYHDYYLLVCCLYEATYRGDKTVSGSYGIALLPSNSTVTPYGIYSHYVSANLFICKPFFYSSMCHPGDAEICELRCDKEYLYSGFIYQDCWPYNEIAGHYRGFNYTDGFLQQAILNVIQDKPVSERDFRLRQTPYIMGGRGNPHKKRKSRRHKKTHKKRKSQKKRKTTYSIFRSNK